MNTHATPHTPAVATPPAWQAVAIGASAGGIRALHTVLGALPPDFALPVLVVLHLQPRHDSLLASVLGARAALRVKPAEGGETLVGRTVYLGIPDRHLEVADGRVVLTSAARVRFSRPSVDVLFLSMAVAYGGAACGVILTGAGRDGADGLAAMKTAGATTIVQDPATADHTGMPLAALATGRVDMTLAVEAIGPMLVRRARPPLLDARPS